MAVFDPGRPPMDARFVFQASPLISCLMVTRGRVDLARSAIACFLAQTYGHRELIAFCQDHESPLKDFIARIGDPRIRFVPAPPGNLGELRNASLAAMRGDLACIWDDDDLYDPLRLELMLSALNATQSNAAFLRRLSVWWPERRQFAVSEARLWEGSMLARKSALPAYPAYRRGEDTAMAEVLVGMGRVVSIDAPGVYVYRVTGSNTWDAEHFETIFSRASHNMSAEYDKHCQRWRAVVEQAGGRT